jgi:hypothetical protein
VTNFTARQQAPSARWGTAHCPVAAPLPIARQYIADRVSIEHRGYITPCWIWQGCVNHHGYAVSRIPGRGWSRVHRASYEEHVGPIPSGLQIDHLCRVKHCCNPDHLEPVTARENLDRHWAAPRAARALRTHCGHGHELTPENMARDGRCLTCHRANAKAFRARQRTAATPRSPDSR